MFGVTRVFRHAERKILTGEARQRRLGRKDTPPLRSTCRRQGNAVTLHGFIASLSSQGQRASVANLEQDERHPEERRRAVLQAHTRGRCHGRCLRADDPGGDVSQSRVWRSWACRSGRARVVLGGMVRHAGLRTMYHRAEARWAITTHVLLTSTRSDSDISAVQRPGLQEENKCAQLYTTTVLLTTCFVRLGECSVGVLGCVPVELACHGPPEIVGTSFFLLISACVGRYPLMTDQTALCWN